MDELDRAMADAEGYVRAALRVLQRERPNAEASRPDFDRIIALLSRTLATAGSLGPRERLVAFKDALEASQMLIDRNWQHQ